MISDAGWPRAGGRPAPRAARAGVWLCAGAALLALAGCLGAKTLGDEPADHVVIGGTPTWSNGVANLMGRKCAVCHQVPRPENSPSNMPHDVDLRRETAAGTVRGAEDLAAQLQLGVLRHPLVYDPGGLPPVHAYYAVRQMPLPFATPLYADEMAALENWAGSVIAAEEAGTSPALSGASPAADGALLYTRFCQSCHGVDGTGGPVQFSLQGLGADAGPYLATQILSTAPAFPMHTWPALVTLANLCTPVGAPTLCNGTQLDAIAAFLAQF
jgi:cytochrome c5